MAQRTGADGLIALVIRVASAGVILALAATVVGALAGCGGGSDEQSSAARSESTAAAVAGTEGSSSPADTPGSKANSSKGDPSSSTKRSTSPGDSSSSVPSNSQEPSAKRGPRVATPAPGELEQGPTPQQRAEATVASIALTSPVLEPGARLPSTYTCDGKDSWPELAWQGVPSGAQELALVAMSMQPVNGEIFYDWAVVGLDPGLSGLGAGALPRGAVMGRNSHGQVGYSICPSEGEETYVFALFALPEGLGLQKGFDPAAMRRKALEISPNGGLLAVSYSRN